MACGVLVAPLERKNCWTIAEHAGHDSPHRLQHPLGRAVWDADGACNDVRGYAVGHLSDPGAVLVVDETGDLKKGTKSVGVQPQYAGTAGRVENAPVAVFLTYAATGGHILIDRRLYLPKGWCDDADRRELASVPDSTRGVHWHVPEGHVIVGRFTVAGGSPPGQVSLWDSSPLTSLLTGGGKGDRLFQSAISHLCRGLVCPQRARAHLLYGEWLRRAGCRVQIANSSTSHQLLTTIGRAALAERARRELVETGQGAQAQWPQAASWPRRNSRSPQLARDGLSNPEIGVRLFIGHRTAEWHLREVFGKLGIESRRA